MAMMQLPSYTQWQAARLSGKTTLDYSDWLLEMVTPPGAALDDQLDDQLLPQDQTSAEVFGPPGPPDAPTAPAPPQAGTLYQQWQILAVQGLTTLSFEDWVAATEGTSTERDGVVPKNWITKIFGQSEVTEQGSTDQVKTRIFDPDFPWWLILLLLGLLFGVSVTTQTQRRYYR